MEIIFGLLGAFYLTISLVMLIILIPLHKLKKHELSGDRKRPCQEIYRFS